MSNKTKPPRCPECGKALYRTCKPKDKRMTPNYPYCRNESCKLHGDIRSAGYCSGEPGKTVKKRNKPESLPKAGKKVVKGKPASKKKHRRRAIPATDAKKKAKRPLPPPKPLCEKCGMLSKACKCEPDSIASTRKNISRVIMNDKAKNMTALSVVVILQELGDDDVANIMIGRYVLEAYGLKKRGKE